MGMSQDRDTQPAADIDTDTKTCLVSTQGASLPESVRSLVEEAPSTSTEQLPSVPALQADVLTAYAATPGDYGRIVHAVRHHPGLFLKPVLMLCREPSRRWTSCVEAELTIPPARAEYQESLTRLAKIAERADSYSSLEGHTRASRLHEMLVLRYLDSRPNRTLEPAANPHLPHGYDYPLVGALAGGADQTGRELLESLRETGLLEGRVVDRLRICPSCNDFRLNFRDACPRCGSLALVEENSIHHFRCSYIGRESEFQQDGLTRCPRGERKLQHAGMDYETTRQYYRCADCGKQFDDPTTQCHCLNCRQTVSPKHTRLRTFREYDITTDGNLAAQSGTYPETHAADLLQGSASLYCRGTFEMLYRLEVARCRRYGVAAALASLTIQNLHATVNDSDRPESRRLTPRIRELLAGTFRETDLLTDISRDRLLIIFTHTPREQAYNALERLRRNLRELAGETVELDIELYDLRKAPPDPEELPGMVD